MELNESDEKQIRNMIGIVGGIGPQAGFELCSKIISQTKALKDQEHLPVVVLSVPEIIEDRSSFIMGDSKINPATAIIEIIKKLYGLGANIIGIPCNASHSPKIYNKILIGLKRENIQVKMIHIIEEVAKFLIQYYPKRKKIGILATFGTYQSGIYNNVLQTYGLEPIIPDLVVQKEVIHEAVYNEDYGIKTVSNPVTKKSVELLKESICHLKSKGAEVVVLGCTEIPLAIKDSQIDEMIVVDSNLVLARALIREAAIDKLRQYLS